MFERLLFKNEPDYGHLLNVGALAEALLFYEHVEVICNSATLEHLCRRIPPAIFLELVKDERMSVYLLKDQLAVHTEERPNQPPRHSLIKISGHDPTFEESAQGALLRCTKDRRVAKAIVSRLHPLGHDAFSSQDLMWALLDAENTTRLVIAALSAMVPPSAINATARFGLYRDGEGLVLDTNLDFDVLNRLYHERVPRAHSSITPAWLISLVQGAKENLHFAAAFRSEIANGCITQSIIREDMISAISKLQRSAEQLDAFNSMAMEGHSLREVINSGAVSFAQFLKILDRADKFKSWITSRPADGNLVRDYYREAVSATWVEKLPGKTFRWMVFSGLGAAVDAQFGTGGLSTAAAQGLSAFDTFLLDKLIRGWKPNQFVDEELMPLVMSETAEKTRISRAS